MARHDAFVKYVLFPVAIILIPVSIMLLVAKLAELAGPMTAP